MEFTLAVTTSGSAVGALGVWSTGIGAEFWKYLLAFSAALAVAKPLLRTTQRMQLLESLISGYRGVEHDLLTIEIVARQRNAYDGELQRRFVAVLERMTVLIVKQTEARLDQNLRRRCEAEVNQELPPEGFFVPDAPGDAE